MESGLQSNISISLEKSSSSSLKYGNAYHLAFPTLRLHPMSEIMKVSSNILLPKIIIMVMIVVIIIFVNIKTIYRHHSNHF